MEASSRSAQRRDGSRIRSRDGGCGGSRARAAWYRRALGGLIQWGKKAAGVEAPAPAAGRAREREPRGRRRRTPLWRSSLRAVGSALARVACICAPACSGVHADALTPRRGRNVRSGGRSPPVLLPAMSMPAGEWVNWSSVFLGTTTSPDEDVLIRRLVLEEEYATRRRMEMQEASKRYGRCWFPPGPSRLSQMSLADDDVSEEDEAGENSSTTRQCSEAESL